MLYKRDGFPEEEEVVLCNVTQIFHNSVFVDILDYRLQGMIHISEIAPGRIRNMRDYVDVNRKIVCKVLRVDKAKGHIDISLRRVTSLEKREKLNEMKQEERAEQIISSAALKLKMPPQELYRLLAAKIRKEYVYLFQCFKDVVEGSNDLAKYGFDKTLATALNDLIKEKFKLPEITLKGGLTITSYAPNGVEIVREGLQLAKKAMKNGSLQIYYLGAGKYHLAVTTHDAKAGEKLLKKAADAALAYLGEQKAIAAFARE